MGLRLEKNAEAARGFENLAVAPPAARGLCCTLGYYVSRQRVRAVADRVSLRSDGVC